MIMDAGNFGEEPKLALDEAGKAYMLETARWSKFLGIVCCVALGLILLLFPAMRYFNPEYPLPGTGTTVFTVFYMFLVLLIYVYPLYTMIQFANKMKPAVREYDQVKFNEALRALKNLYRYIGICTIILLFIYGIVLVFSLTIALTSSI